MTAWTSITKNGSFTTTKRRRPVPLLVDAALPPGAFTSDVVVPPVEQAAAKWPDAPARSAFVIATTQLVRPPAGQEPARRTVHDSLIRASQALVERPHASHSPHVPRHATIGTYCSITSAVSSAVSSAARRSRVDEPCGQRS